ncbi:MAG: hypothetical protein ACJ75J_15230 [Cytophagaceae bacterium]
MTKGLWLYFDVPYAEGANAMRALFGYSDDNKNIQVISIEGCKDIPDAVSKAEAEATQKKITIDHSLVLVIPLDDRMGLAWPVREMADNKKYEFSRHIPSNQFPAPAKLILYSAYNNGSREVTMEKEVAQQKIHELNEQAKQEFSGGDMLPVMTLLRHAMSLSVQHFGWTHPLTGFTLRNLMYCFRGTGNGDNEFEGKFLVLQMIEAFNASPPSRTSWQDSDFILEHIADNLNAMQESELAASLQNLPMI